MLKYAFALSIYNNSFLILAANSSSDLDDYDMERGFGVSI